MADISLTLTSVHTHTAHEYTQKLNENSSVFSVPMTEIGPKIPQVYQPLISETTSEMERKAKRRGGKRRKRRKKSLTATPETVPAQSPHSRQAA